MLEQNARSPMLICLSLVDERYDQLKTKYREGNGSSNRLDSTKEPK